MTPNITKYFKKDNPYYAVPQITSGFGSGTMVYTAPMSNCQTYCISSFNAILTKPITQQVEILREIREKIINKHQLLVDVNQSYLTQIKALTAPVAGGLVFYHEYKSSNGSNMVICLINVTKVLEHYAKTAPVDPEEDRVNTLANLAARAIANVKTSLVAIEEAGPFPTVETVVALKRCPGRPKKIKPIEEKTF